MKAATAYRQSQIAARGGRTNPAEERPHLDSRLFDSGDYTARARRDVVDDQGVGRRVAPALWDTGHNRCQKQDEIGWRSSDQREAAEPDRQHAESRSDSTNPISQSTENRGQQCSRDSSSSDQRPYLAPVYVELGDQLGCENTEDHYGESRNGHSDGGESTQGSAAEWTHR